MAQLVERRVSDRKVVDSRFDSVTGSVRYGVGKDTLIPIGAKQPKGLWQPILTKNLLTKRKKRFSALIWSDRR